MLTPLTASTFAAAAGTALIGIFSVMDCSPSLYYANRWGFAKPDASQRRVWIIGASDGIGKELALQLAKHCEAQEIILSSRSRDKLLDIKKDIASLNPSCDVSVLPMDVCETSSIDTAFEVLTSTKRTLDTVVINAGAGSLGLVEESKPLDVNQIMQVNAIWPMVLVPRLLRDKRLFPLPHFVVTASVASVMPVPLSASYAAAKHALLGYFRTILAELPTSRIHTFLPGPVDTNFYKSESGSNTMKLRKERCVELMRTGMQFDQSKEFFIARQPLLFLLYLNQMFPSLLMSLVYRRVGPKRRSLWKRGLDLYDPKSWRL